MKLNKLEHFKFNFLQAIIIVFAELSLVTSEINLRMKSKLTENVKILRVNDLFHDSMSPIYNLTFAVLLPYEEDENESDCIMAKVMPTIEIAIRHVQRLGFSSVNFDVTLVSRDSFCSSAFGPIGFFEIYSDWKDINAIFGLCCPYVLAPVSRYAGIWNIPVFSTGGRVASFDSKQYYQTLTRLMGGAMETGRIVRNLLESFNWTRSALLYENSKSNTPGHSTCFHCISGIHNELQNKSVYQVGFERNAFHKDYIAMELQKIRKLARIVIMCGDPNIIREIMLTAQELGMIDSGEFVFINLELFSRTYTLLLPWYERNDTDANNQRAKKAYTAMLTITPKQLNDIEYIRISNKIKSIAIKEYNYTFHENDSLSEYVTSFYDGVLLYANALNDSIKESPEQLPISINGSDMVHRMWNRSFHGITGNVTIDINGDRISAYSLLDMNPKTGRFEIIGQFLDNHLKYIDGKVIHWANDRTEPPLDVPECGYDGSLCIKSSLPGYAILSMVLSVIVVIMTIGFIFSYRHYKVEAEINSMTWKVTLDEVIFPMNEQSFYGSFNSFAQHESRQMTIMSDDIISFNEDRYVFITVGIYKGCKAAIKKIHKDNINLNRSLMLELKRMKDIQHDHLVKFYGACLDPEKKFFLTEYCPKGSLQDILENDQFQLDWMFKLSLVHDIVRGMQFLHNSEIKSHGNLKSSNCVVDSRFVLKITDFGLHALRKPKIKDDDDKCTNHAYWCNYLWTSPELLRMEHDRPPEGTQKGDVYSFGIIVHEITIRQGPFHVGKMGWEHSPQEVIQLVMGYPDLVNPPFRPKIEKTVYEEINNLMQKCWSEEPEERPDFQALKATIRKINKNNETGNIVDNLLKRMEQYANNLEELVEERTQDYIEEKKKCEKLLYQLLPESVAAQLIRGQPVVAETFEHVTIYFSDIVGFTTISAESTPMQIVKFLNDLYTCFDSIVENYDVYKVETIGDAYMVVSGLPLRNGNRHAREVARLALALLDAVHNFKIHHRPNDQLKLRIGLHSGPCVAGVVGLKMPRYCLFGDTVNTASRMESNGEALKIHISQTTKTSLDQFGTFVIRKRGLIPIKGKGEMLTYWLEREDNMIAATHDSHSKNIIPPTFKSSPPKQTNCQQHPIATERGKLSLSSMKLHDSDLKTEDNDHTHITDSNNRVNCFNDEIELTNFRLPLAVLKKPTALVNQNGQNSSTTNKMRNHVKKPPPLCNAKEDDVSSSANNLISNKLIRTHLNQNDLNLPRHQSRQNMQNNTNENDDKTKIVRAGKVQHNIENQQLTNFSNNNNDSVDDAITSLTQPLLGTYSKRTA